MPCESQFDFTIIMFHVCLSCKISINSNPQNYNPKCLYSKNNKNIPLRMIDRVIEVNGKEITIGQDLSLSHAGTIWDGALCLVGYWNKNIQIAKQFIADKNVLELGSGTGIVGIAAFTFAPKKLFLTDLEDYLKILSINKQKNKELCLSVNGDLIVQKLEWFNKEDMSNLPKIDTIIGSQLAYDKENVSKLMMTLKYFRELNKDLKIVISYQKNKELWKNLEVQFAEHFQKQDYTTVAWNDFDYDYRDDGLGIIQIQ